MLLFSRSCADCSRHPTFDKSRSSTFKDRQTTAYNAYATGSATGRWVTDRVEMSTSYVNNQPFHLVEAGPLASYVGNEISGIMGLGPAGIAAQSPKGPIMETPAQFYVTAARTVWDQPEFGVFLKRTNTNPTQTVIGSTATEPTEPESGVITFGGINETYVSPDSITYMPANTTHWWQLPLEAIVINGRPLPASNVPTVIDTGATMNYFPFPICQIILDNVPRALHLTDEKGNVDGTFAIPCKSKFSLSFRFAGKDYALDSADLIRSRVPDGMLNRVGGNAQLSDYCMANFAAGSWLLGAAFMKNVYTVFRMSDPPSIGFGALTAAATQKNPSATGSGKGSSSGSASSLPKNSAAVGHKGLSARALTAAGVVLSLFV